MGNYVTTATREHPNLGYDPCPGSPSGTRDVAELVRTFAERTGEITALLEGARNDTQMWAGGSQRAFQEAMVEFPPKLRQVSDAFGTAQTVLVDWADELEDFQRRSLELDRQLGEARAAVTTAEEAAEANAQDADPLYQPPFPPSPYAPSAVDIARSAASGIEGDAEGLHQEYLERARHFGSILNQAGDSVWSSSWWDTLWSHVDDLGDWLEDSFVGEIARALAPISEWVSKIGGWVSAGLLVLAGIALVIPGAQVAVPFLLAGSAIAGTAATVADGLLAVGGQGSWGTVGLGLLTIGIGKGVAKATEKVIDIYQATGRSSQLVRVQTPGGTHEYLPSLFTTPEMHNSELVWQAIRLKGSQANWVITGTGLAGSLHGYEEQDPWDLPSGAAYLEDRDGELVK